MINFAVGPVQIDPEIRAIGAEEVPYFRTAEFSRVMLDNEKMILGLFGAPEGSRAVFLTGSGSAAMEAAVVNLFTKEDKVLVVNGGSFGARFAKICRIHGIPCEEVVPEAYGSISADDLEPFAGKGFTGLLVNQGETSTGVLHDMDLISGFCRREGLRLAVDAVSSFLADDVEMEKWGADLVLTSSQKALALPPGLSILALSPRALRRVEEVRYPSLYFDLAEALKNGERGQTPFTPAVGILMQLNARLGKITADGDVRGRKEHERIRRQAEDFRKKIAALPFEVLSRAPSNAVTSLHPAGHYADGTPVSARRIFDVLKDEYGIWICPNGGERAETSFRVGHLGHLTPGDNDALIAALRDLEKRGLI